MSAPFKAAKHKGNEYMNTKNAFGDLDASLRNMGKNNTNNVMQNNAVINGVGAGDNNAAAAQQKKTANNKVDFLKEFQ